MTTTFETAKVGDKVWCMRSGWGEIRGTDSSKAYPIAVYFTSDEFKTYTVDGQYDEEDLNQTLFWGEVVIDAPEKPMPDLKVDAKVLVWVRSDEKFKRHFSHFKDGQIVTFDCGKTSFTTSGEYDLTGWPNWELAE